MTTASVPPPADDPAELPVARALDTVQQAIAESRSEGVSTEPSLVGRLLSVLEREPLLFVSLAYLLVSCMGLWSSYWLYRGLGLPILDYMQGSDLFMAGLRRPGYVVLLASALAVTWLSAWPLRWAELNPERASVLRARGWGWRLLFPHRRSFMALWGVRSDTLLVLGAMVLSLYYLYMWNTAMAERIVAGKSFGHEVRLTLAGADAPLSGQAQLLGTTSTFVLVWWPQAARVEALPTANIARIESAVAVHDAASDAASTGRR